MRVRHWLVMLLALPLAGCGGCRGCGCSSGPRPDPDAEKKPPAALSVRLQAATTSVPKGSDVPADLAAALRDDSPHVRRAAIFTVRRSGADPATISAALTPLLKDPDLFLRVVAAEALWDTNRDSEALEVMRKVLRDGDARARTRAVRALGDVGPAAKDIAPQLSALLKGADAEAQQVVAEALAQIKYADVPAVAEAMWYAQANAARTGDYRTHRALARVIVSMGKDAVPPLIRMMNNGTPEQQKSAALAASELGAEARSAVPALIELLKVRQLNTHQTAAEVLGHLGPDAGQAVLHLMDMLDDDDPDTAQVAAVALGGIGQPALQPLMVRLHSKKAKNDLAIVALARLGKDAVPPLLDSLKSDDPALRLRAALALAGMDAPPKEALPVLLAFLKEWAENAENLAAPAVLGFSILAERQNGAAPVQRVLSALGNFKADAADAVPLVTPLLKDRTAALRRAAALALGHIGKPARPAVPALRELMLDAEPGNARAAMSAADALLAIGLDRKEDAGLIIEIIRGGQNARLRGPALRALGRLGPDAVDSVPALLKVFHERQEEIDSADVTEAFGRIGKGALPALTRALHDKETRSRHLAAAWTHLGKEAVDVLIPALLDEDEEVRKLAADSMGSMGPNAKAAGSALAGALKDLDFQVRAAAARALPHVGADPAKAVPALAAALLDPKPAVREAAANALFSYGADAAPAEEALLATLRSASANSGELTETAFETLRRLGPTPARVAAMTAIVKDGRGDSRRLAVVLLGYCGADAKEAVPVLRELRHDERIGDTVTVALWNIDQDAQAAGVLLDGLQSTDPKRRVAAAVAAGHKGAVAAMMVPAMTDLLRDRNASVRIVAARRLGEMGEAARSAIPELITLFRRDRDEAVTLAVAEALGQLGTDSHDALPLVKDLIKGARLEVRARLHLACWRIAQDREALTALAALLDDRDGCMAAADALAEIGPAAKSVVPALRKQQTNPERDGFDLLAIDRALRKIERN
jgi:HEAT repeat protein